MLVLINVLYVGALLDSDVEWNQTLLDLIHQALNLKLGMVEKAQLIMAQGCQNAERHRHNFQHKLQKKKRKHFATTLS